MDLGEKESNVLTKILVNNSFLLLPYCHLYFLLFLCTLAFPDGSTTYKGSVPPAMTTDAVNYLRDANFKMFQVSEIKTYPILVNLYFVMRKEFHTWHYSGGKLLTGCWTGVTVYQYINHP